MQKLRSLFFTAKAVLEMAAKSGQVLTTTEIVDQRLNECRACPELNHNRCKVCGCLIALKAGLAAAECPKGKWL